MDEAGGQRRKRAGTDGILREKIDFSRLCENTKNSHILGLRLVWFYREKRNWSIIVSKYIWTFTAGSPKSYYHDGHLFEDDTNVQLFLCGLMILLNCF